MKCVICGKEIEGYGNNPYPVRTDREDCCDECNEKYVIPARIAFLSRPDKSVTMEQVAELLNKASLEVLDVLFN